MTKTMSTSKTFHDWLMMQVGRTDDIGIFAAMVQARDDAPKYAMRTYTWRKWIRANGLAERWERVMYQAFSEFGRSR